jgi:hypothetical protein
MSAVSAPVSTISTNEEATSVPEIIIPDIIFMTTESTFDGSNTVEPGRELRIDPSNTSLSAEFTNGIIATNRSNPVNNSSGVDFLPVIYVTSSEINASASAPKTSNYHTEQGK